MVTVRETPGAATVVVVVGATVANVVGAADFEPDDPQPATATATTEPMTNSFRALMARSMRSAGRVGQG